MSRSWRWIAFGVLVLTAVAVVGSLVTTTGRVAGAVRGGVAAVTASTVVCPNVGGGPGGATTDMIVAHVTAGAAPKVTYVPVSPDGGAQRSVPVSLNPVALVQKSTPYAAVAVTATGAGAEGVVASQTGLIPGGLGRGLTDIACLPTTTDAWFVGADGRIGITDLMFLVNPSDVAANVGLSFWSSNGRLEPPNASGIDVPAHSALLRRIADLAPDIAGVSLHVHANSGTVAASMVDLESSGARAMGSDWIAPAAAPTRSTVVTGFMPGATLDRLDVVNPGDRDATLSLRVVTPTKNFVPAGHETVVVPAGRTSSVDLSGSISGEAAAVVIASDLPVTAAGLTAQQPRDGLRELAWLPAQQPLRTAAGIANNIPPFGQKVHLIVSAPAAAAKLRVTAASGTSVVVNVAAGRTVDVDLRALMNAGSGGPGPLLLTPLDGPVYVERTMYAIGAHGPLLAASAPMVLPRPTILPPVVADTRAGLP